MDGRGVKGVERVIGLVWRRVSGHDTFSYEGAHVLVVGRIRVGRGKEACRQEYDRKVSRGSVPQKQTQEIPCCVDVIENRMRTIEWSWWLDKSQSEVLNADCPYDTIVGHCIYTEYHEVSYS